MSSRLVHLTYAFEKIFMGAWEGFFSLWFDAILCQHVGRPLKYHGAPGTKGYGASRIVGKKSLVADSIMLDVGGRIPEVDEDTGHSFS